MALTEFQYLHLIDKILVQGHIEEGRNGRTKSVFGHMFRFSLANGTIPIVTTKRTAWKTCLKELLWFIRGDMRNTLLNSQGVHIWDANCSREFLDSRGLPHYVSDDELGPIYGYQWRHFGKPYVPQNTREYIRRAREQDASGNELVQDIFQGLDTNETEGIDQLQQIIDALKDPAKRNSRRLLMTAWNPAQLDEMALPPCHVMCQFDVCDGNKLRCALYQRSADVMLGVPFNITSYAFLTHLIAHHCGLVADEFVHFLGNCHIYEQHLASAVEQQTRHPLPFPTIRITALRENIDDYTVDDFAVDGYECHPPIKMEMVA